MCKALPAFPQLQLLSDSPNTSIQAVFQDGDSEAKNLPPTPDRCLSRAQRINPSTGIYRCPEARGHARPSLRQLFAFCFAPNAPCSEACPGRELSLRKSCLQNTNRFNL
jgi:hypothetical protein